VSGFRSTRDGVKVRLTRAEGAMLRSLTEQLMGLLTARAAEAPVDLELAEVGIGGPSDAPRDPALARLLPNAYSDDPAASAEHRRLTESGLVDRKLTNARTVLRTVEGTKLSADEAQAWVRTLTDLRLTIATRLGIESDDDPGTGPAELLTIYGWLGYLQATLVDSIDRPGR
jgi:hypothetical protein